MTASRWTAVLAAGVLLLAGACGDDDDDGADEPGAVDTAAPAGGSTVPGTDAEEPSGDGSATTLRARFASDPTLLDPLYVANYTDISVVSIIFESLVQAAPDGSTVNVLADTYEIADDGLTIDFTLKQGVQFHGGYGEMTMDDVKFSIERAAGLIEGVESTSITAFYTALDSVEVIDDYTGRIVLQGAVGDARGAGAAAHRHHLQEGLRGEWASRGSNGSRSAPARTSSPRSCRAST